MNLDAAARRGEHAHHDREQRRLARSVGAHEPEPHAVRYFEVDPAQGVDRDGSDVLPTDRLDDAMLEVVVKDREQFVLRLNLPEADVCHHATQYGSRDRARVKTATPR